MKIKPIILDRIQTRHTNYLVDLRLNSNITFITGDSGTGKSAVFSILEEHSSEDKRIRCFNYMDRNKGYKASIRNSKKKLFVIDNADILLDDKMRQHIAVDTSNQYIIIGRNPTGLLLMQDEIYELSYSNEGGIIVFTLVKAFL